MPGMMPYGGMGMPPGGMPPGPYGGGRGNPPMNSSAPAGRGFYGR